MWGKSGICTKIQNAYEDTRKGGERLGTRMRLKTSMRKHNPISKQIVKALKGQHISARRRSPSSDLNENEFENEYEIENECEKTQFHLKANNQSPERAAYISEAVKPLEPSERERV